MSPPFFFFPLDEASCLIKGNILQSESDRGFPLPSMPLSRRRDDCDDANISCSVRYEHQFALPMDDSFVWAQKRGNNLLGTPLLPYLASLILETRLEHRAKFVLWMRMAIRLFILLLSFGISVKKEIANSPQKGRIAFKCQKPFLGDNNVRLFCASVRVCRY